MLAHRQVEQVDESALEVIRSRLRERMETLRMSGNEISRKANLGLSYVNDILSGQSRNPHQSRLKAVATALECDLGYLVGEQDTPRLRGGEVKLAERSSRGSSVVQPFPREAGEPQKFDVFSGSWPDAEGFFELQPAGAIGSPVEGVVDGRAVIVPDDSMAPRFRTGETVFVAPRRPVAPGVGVVVTLSDGKTVIREIVSLTAESVEVKALATGATTTFRRGEIATIHRIIAVAVL